MGELRLVLMVYALVVVWPRNGSVEEFRLTFMV